MSFYIQQKRPHKVAKILNIKYLDINQTFENLTPLQRSCLHGAWVCAKLIIASNADINARDSTGKSALHFCCQTDKEDMLSGVRLLVNAGCDIFFVDAEGYTASDYCLKAQKYDIVDYLEKQEAGIGNPMEIE